MVHLSSAKLPSIRPQNISEEDWRGLLALYCGDGAAVRVREVAPGQVWRDNDPRIRESGRQERLLQVQAVEGDYVSGLCLTSGRKFRAQKKRFNPLLKTGYSFVHD